MLPWGRIKLGDGMKRLIGALIVVLLAVLPVSVALACSQPAGAKAIEAELVGWINAERAKKGLNQLDNNPALKKAAQRHACDMAKNNFLSHTGSDGSKMRGRVQGAGYRYKTAVENVGMDSRAPSARAMGQSWRNSAPHWKNLMKRGLDDMGVGFAVSGGKVYYVFVGAGK